ncbi:MAG TPA: hypothetical protein VM123_04710 [archaeon]|nr:hypothetical protein [archaeon]
MFTRINKSIQVTVWLILITTCCARKTGIDWQYSADFDRDGSPEVVKVVDLNQNGRPERIGDFHLTGREDSLEARLWIDSEFDLDGEPDELRIYVDRNRDGHIDTTEGWLRRCVDLDDDGICDDLDSDLHELDLTGKGFIHQRIRYHDSDNDGDADLLCEYPAYNLSSPKQAYLYITGKWCMRETWRGTNYGFGWGLYLDDDDDGNVRWDADGAGTSVFHVRRPREPLGIGVEGRRSTGEAHRWYDFDGDGYTDMHLRDYGPGIMRWSFDWDGDAPIKYPLDKPVPPLDAHVDYDVAFHTLGEVPRGWWAGDQLKLWDFLVGLDLPGYYRERGTAFDFGRDFVPANSCVYYTLHAPWRIISLNWLEDQENPDRTKDVGCHRHEGIWSYYYDFDPQTAFIGSRRDFDRDGNSSFRLYLSPIDSLYHLYEAEDGIFYRDPDCRRPHFMLRPTEENIRSYVREIISYSDTDNDGFFDTFSYDRDLDGEPDEVRSYPESDQAGLTDMTEIWRCGMALDSLYHPGREDTLPVIFEVEVVWKKTNYNLEAQIRLSSSRPLVGYQLWLRAEEHVDYNILCRSRLQDGQDKWELSETIPRAQFVLPGLTRVTALLVNNVGRIVGSSLAGVVEIEPLNSPAMLLGFYRAWSGNLTREPETYVRMGPEEVISIGDLIKLEVGLEFMNTKEMRLTFEPFLTDQREVSRWPLGKKVSRAATGEMLLSATVKLVPFEEEVLQAAGGSEADPSLPVSLEDYLGIREEGDRVYIPPGRTYRLGFRLYTDNRLIEDRILYYDWIKDVPQIIHVKNSSLLSLRKGNKPE